MLRKIALNEDNYYSIEADQNYFSVSQYKDFMKCEAMAMAKIRGEYKPEMTKAMLTGSFVDSYFVSIHAPAKGATMEDLKWSEVAEFQSTLPRRERQYELGRI